MGLVQFFYNYAIGILYYYNFAFHLETKFVAQWMEKSVKTLHTCHNRILSQEMNDII